MATKFADLSKPVTSLLNDDYTSKVNLKVKTSAGPIGVTIETERGNDATLSSKLSGKFSLASFTCDKLQFTADGSRALETSLKLNPNLKLTYKGSKGADLGVEYVKGNLYTTSTLDVLTMDKLTSSACLYVPESRVKAGGDLTYSIKNGGIPAFNLGASYTTGSGNCFGAVTATNKLSKWNLALSYKVNPTLTIASSTAHSASKVCEVAGIGCIYNPKNSPLGTIKAKMTTDHTLHACVVTEIVPKVTLTASASINPGKGCPYTAMKTLKPGFGISI